MVKTPSRTETKCLVILYFENALFKKDENLEIAWRNLMRNTTSFIVKSFERTGPL